MIGILALSIAHVGFLLWAAYHWRRVSVTEPHSAQNYQFSVLVPVRNESKNLPQLIDDLQHLQYPHAFFEVIVINDSSDDDTQLVAENSLKKTSLNYQVIDLGVLGETGKKRALTLGISKARFEHIITTDGDCSLPKSWLQAYADAYDQGDWAMLAGPVKMTGDSWFERVQAVEFAGLIGIGAASLASKNPGMCNGANLSYRKEIFLAVDGYQGNENIPSGDDEFLLQKVYRHAQGKVSFLKDRRAVVSTAAKPTFLSFINQRIRWSSKWRFHKSWYVRLLAILVFMDFFGVAWMLTVGLWDIQFTVLIISVMGLRTLALRRFLYPVAQFLGVPRVNRVAVLLEIIYPFLVLFLGIASIFGKYSWKGRNYS
ncbi:glycosyltransferase [Marinoscillum furvescens]|uniref:Cellulose synthase/poly-beta-1,6-N-acetylglucosamine synthase-like glycosyltransferase n=1 Tax=Marinoscillum furvescens DSM 4134 TaxID=1122208 RepID=A0A3D9LGC4_MARFU|nr:glycosyltransferase [Marinoscillum furvescens]REE05730.1 cellulose synthase/poly-beta-1,6-N-acetylglucosamine synthase-like glycosyltransferase [Marinoscillum furvescens DSM 4134]